MAHKLRILGPPEVLDGDGKAVSLSLGKPLALLIYVACNSSTVSRADLADLLWPETDRQRGKHSVRQALWVLRNAIGEDLFESHDPLCLREGVLEVDLHLFVQDLAEGRVEEARARWKGPVLDHLLLAGVRSWNHWAEELRGDLDHRFSKALLGHAQSLVEAGEASGAVSALEQAIEISPSAEAYHLARIELLLDLLRLDAARQALSDAHGCLGDHPESAGRLTVLELKLDQILQEQRSRVAEGEIFPMEFVGRSRELAGLHALWRDADSARTRIAVITGPSGIGKTRLAQELLSYVSNDETRSVGLKGTRAEMKLRWGAASDLVRQLLRLPGSAGISPASDSLLRAMLPSMGRAEVNLQTVNGVSPAAILDAVLDLLESITFEAPLVVLVDDAQWIDPESRTLFIGLANRCREVRILLLILGRSDLSSRHWADVESSLVDDGGARRFLLAPLIEEEVGELLALGASFPDPDDALDLVTRIHRASAGNPLFILEILKEFHEKGILHREETGWIFYTSEIPVEFDLPENIRLLLRERLDRLSEPGASLAATLAAEDKRSSTETLRKATQLPSNIFTGAVAELLERGVIEWVDGTSLDFVHDLLRDTASTHLAGSLPQAPERAKWLTRNQGILALVLGILFALPLGILWERGALPWGGTPDPPRYGGGSIVFFRQGNDPIQLEVTASQPKEWQPEELEQTPPPGTRHLFRTVSGGFAWFGSEERPDGPDMTRILPDGYELPLFPEPGDQTIYDLSPDGSRVLFVSENVGREPYSHSLYLGWIEAGRKELVYEGHGHVAFARWSTDADLMAFSARGRQDTLVVSSAQGERMGSAVLGNINGITWCGPSVVASTSLGEEALLLKFNPPAMTVDTLGQVGPETRISCSPDGSALAYIGIIDRRLAPVVQDLVSGEVHTLSFVDGQINSPVWLPPPGLAIPMRIRAETDTIRMEWGDELPFSASVLHSDGTESSAGIWWESADPAVASMGPHQELTGNGAGRTKILARWGASLVDTVVVEVDDTGAEGAVRREEFLALDPAIWMPVGSHPPEVVLLDGNPVLHMRGDAKYTDGLMLREPLPIGQGITVEMEFKMDLTREVHQNFGFCLRDMDLEGSDLESGYLSYAAEACTHYPAQELYKLDPSEASVRTNPGRERRVRAPDVLPSDDWVHMAIQVRADGEATLVVGRQRLASSPVALETGRGREWSLIIQGNAVGTELYVRNLAIWLGERY